MSDSRTALAEPASRGVPLEAGVRDLVSASYGHDFSRVRVHADRESAAAARALDARAFTVGNDVSFAANAYDPLSQSGRSLIAHELAHVAQQAGHRRGPSFSRDHARGSLPRADARMEAQADSAAARHRGPLPPHWQWERSSNAFLGRAETDWQPVPAYTVTYADQPRVIDREQWSEDAPEAARVSLGTFRIPQTKGPWEAEYNRIAEGGGLQATLAVNTGRIRTVQWQQRADTAELRRLWLIRVGWPAQGRTDAQWWNDAGGDAGGNSFEPKVGNIPSQIDHIVELQLGGTNVPENLTPHNGPENERSGREIWADVRSAAQAVAEQIAARPGGQRLTNLTLSWDSAQMKANYQDGDALEPLPVEESRQAEVLARRRGHAAKAVQVHKTALNDKTAGSRPGPRERAAEAEHRQSLIEYPITAGPSHATLLVEPHGTSDLIENSRVPENDANRELISGLVLEKLERGRSGDHVIGWLNSDQHPVRTGTRLPLRLQSIGERLQFAVGDVGTTGRLTLPSAGRQIRFSYPYLSTGTIGLGLTDEGLVGHGTLTPSVPLLARVPIDIDLDRRGLRGTVRPRPGQLSLRPFTVTDAGLTVALGPELSASGFVAFGLGRIADGRIEAAVDGSGFHATGDITAHVPGLDTATAHVTYRPATGLSGHLVIGASGRGGPVTGGEVTVDFTNNDWTVSGRLSLLLPGGGPAELSVVRHGERVLYTGRGSIRVPGLRPVDAEIAYDGTHLSGQAHTSFTLLGATGDLTVAYRDGRVTGEGHVVLQRDQFRGEIDARLDEHGRLSGRGQAQLEIRPGLVGQVGVEYTPDHHLHLSGELRFPPYRFLDQHAARHELFHHNLPDIPIFAIPLGVTSIGIVARIGGGLAVHYSFGPGELRDMVIRASFDPLEADPNAAIEAEARVVLPAEAGLELFVDATLGVSAGVASATGGIRVTGGAVLRGDLSAAARIAYAHSIATFDAETRISIAPALTLAIDAELLLEASLIGEKRYAYQLASWSYTPGLVFGMVAPFHYRSDQPLRLPAASDIQWIVPDIDVRALVSQLSDRVEDGLGI